MSDLASLLRKRDLARSSDVRLSCNTDEYNLFGSSATLTLRLGATFDLLAALPEKQDLTTNSVILFSCITDEEA